MKVFLKSMQKKKIGVPEKVLPVFEGIINKYETQSNPGSGAECDTEFRLAMDKHLTQQQRFMIFEENGGCKGTGEDKRRKEFALKNAKMPLAKRLELFEKTFYGADSVLNKDNTITVKFACHHGHYRQARLAKGKYKLPKDIKTYFECCSGGRLHHYQKGLGIKLKIKSVDISSLYENPLNPVEFIFEIVE